jgi:hypothetical protein
MEDALLMSALDLHQAQISVDTARVDVSRFTTFGVLSASLPILVVLYVL